MKTYEITKMKTYDVQIQATVIKTIRVEAQNLDEAIGNAHSRFTVVNEEDVEVLESLKDSKDYIDIAISNNLLISNRKLRRKLEMILEKSNFASVEYIDDITKELVDGDEINESSIEEDGSDISINLDYEDYIKEYILKQKYDNKKFKNGVISEFDEIIKIFRENYSSKSE
jgi:hypothetical protein